LTFTELNAQNELKSAHRFRWNQFVSYFVEPVDEAYCNEKIGFFLELLESYSEEVAEMWHLQLRQSAYKLPSHSKPFLEPLFKKQKPFAPAAVVLTPAEQLRSEWRALFQDWCKVGGCPTMQLEFFQRVGDSISFRSNIPIGDKEYLHEFVIRQDSTSTTLSCLTPERPWSKEVPLCRQLCEDTFTHYDAFLDLFG